MGRTFGITDAIKRVAMGDTSAYRNPAFRGEMPTQPRRLNAPDAQFGRIYADPTPNAAARDRVLPKLLPLAGMRRLCAAVASIGSYDHTRAQ